MAKKRRSEEGAIIAYFSMRSKEDAEALYSIVVELMRRRRQEGKPQRSKEKKKATEPVMAVSGTLARTFPPDVAAKAHGE